MMFPVPPFFSPAFFVLALPMVPLALVPVVDTLAAPFVFPVLELTIVLDEVAALEAAGTPGSFATEFCLEATADEAL